MKPIITKFNDKTGDVEITIPVPFTLKDGIEYANMMIADIPKYEDTKDYNVFDLIRENQELKKKLDELQMLYNNMFKCHCNRVQVETLLSQQKEFIEWLENKMKETHYTMFEFQAYRLVFEKYKEIVGV